MAAPIDLSSISGSITNITVKIHYQGSEDAYIDNLSLSVEKFGTQLTYNDKGNLITTTDINGKATNYTYTGNDVNTIIPDGNKNTSFTYNSDHQVESITNNSKLSFTYDENGNVKSTNLSDSKLVHTVRTLSNMYAIQMGFVIST